MEKNKTHTTPQDYLPTQAHLQKIDFLNTLLKGNSVGQSRVHEGIVRYSTSDTLKKSDINIFSHNVTVEPFRGLNMTMICFRFLEPGYITNKINQKT